MGQYQVDGGPYLGVEGIVIDTGPGAPALLEVELRFAGPSPRRNYYDRPLLQNGENVGYASVKIGGA